ncbi:MAG: DUF1844 domain-containing protein [Deltaproteobacteria bacterium]|jgi:hypothetical protein|nr:DUF1844 domain-containing protein [Deltaproteobacteria bacterium]
MNDPDERSKGAAIDFSTFVLSLGTTALYQLGQIGDPEEGAEKRREPNLPIAKQTIDTLEMLTEKTRGNLTDTESKLLESILYELHMKFVEASK